MSKSVVSHWFPIVMCLSVNDNNTVLIKSSDVKLLCHLKKKAERFDYVKVHHPIFFFFFFFLSHFSKHAPKHKIFINAFGWS